MKKYLELLFLRQLNGIGVAKINSMYNSVLAKSNSIDDLVENGNINLAFSSEEIETAKTLANSIYAKHVDDPELRIITMFDDEYPKMLNDLKNKKPVILYCRGNSELLSKESTAVIGTRHISDKGVEVTRDITGTIVKDFGRVIVSGLALGCDQVAHKAALDSNGFTIAVLPCGLDTVVPASNRGLAEAIVDNNGCILSEYEFGTSVNKFNYTERDRITAALSKETMVIECSEDSGTMKTVNSALDLGRRIGCYIPLKCGEGDYSGNNTIVSSMGGTKCSDIEELKKFYEQQTEPKQMSLFD